MESLSNSSSSEEVGLFPGMVYPSMSLEVVNGMLAMLTRQPSPITIILLLVDGVDEMQGLVGFPLMATILQYFTYIGEVNSSSSPPDFSLIQVLM